MSDPDNTGFPFMFMANPEQVMEHMNAQRRRGDQQARGKAAINATLMDEYYALVERCKAYDEILVEHPDGAGITQELAAAAWVRHDLAATLAKRLYDGIANPDQCSEFLAQFYEHKAASERWNLRLARCIGLLHSAVPVAEGGMSAESPDFAMDPTVAPDENTTTDAPEQNTDDATGADQAG